MQIPFYCGAQAASFPDIKDVRLPEGTTLVMPVQTHTANVGVVTDPRQTFPDTDALITQLSDVAVGIRTADCVPILLYAPDIEAVAAIHAGWRGTLAGIAIETIARLSDLGADPRLIHAAFGPSICGACYETGEELATEFIAVGLAEVVTEGAAPDPLGRQTFGDDSVRVDLQRANTLLMTRHGLKPENIRPSNICTRHTTTPLTWPSWRRIPSTPDRLITLIRLS